VAQSDTLFTYEFIKTSLFVTIFSYTSVDGSCTGVETTERNVEYSYREEGPVAAITGWVNLDQVVIAAPLAQNGSGALSNNATVTPLTLQVVTDTSGDKPPGSVEPEFFVVDDTLAGVLVMYQKSAHSADAVGIPINFRTECLY